MADMSNDEKLEIIYTSMKLMEEELRLKNELIAVLKEQNGLLEARVAQLLSMLDKTQTPKKKG